MKDTQQAARRLAESTAAAVRRLWGRVRDGEITEDDFRSVASELIATANASGVTLADLGLTREIIRQTGTPGGPSGLQPTPVQVDRRRIESRLASLLEPGDDDDIDGESQFDAIDGLARSEVYLTVANSVQAGMAQVGIQRWVRQLSGTSCVLCTGWADGIARSVDTPMARHVGCDCLQQPVF